MNQSQLTTGERWQPDGLVRRTSRNHQSDLQIAENENNSPSVTQEVWDQSFSMEDGERSRTARPVEESSLSEIRIDSSNVRWQDYEPPHELEETQPSTPMEIQRIVKESLVRVRASIASDAVSITSAARPMSIGADSAAPDQVSPLSGVQVVLSSADVGGGMEVVTSPTYQSCRSSSSAVTTGSTIPDTRGSLHRLSLASLSSKTSVTSSLAESTVSRATSKPKQPREAYIAGPVALALSPVQGTYTGERYVPPKLESPYAKKIKKLLEKRKGAGECASCLDDMKNKKLVSLACQHKYCGPCFIQLIHTAMMDENHFPPRCCLQEVPSKVVHNHLPNSLQNAYLEKTAEYATPPGDRWYCPSPHCSKWIDRRHVPAVGGTIGCYHCNTAICVICRGEAHAYGAECPQDFGLEATLEVSERNGWQRCYACHAMVELTDGCRHITCKCKAEFCYVCGERWRTCSCTEVDRARRQQQIQERRDALTAEEREVEEAIAAVARAEAREAREAEEAEAARVAEEGRLARAREQIRVAEIRSSFRTLREALDALHESQHASMTARHEREASALAEQARLQLESCQARQQQEMDGLAARHEEEEDDYFIGLRAHLRGKPNREAREKAAIAKIAAVQEEERASLLAQQQRERDALANAERGGAGQVCDAKRRHLAEGRWFTVVKDARAGMLDESERTLAASGEDLRAYQGRVGQLWAVEAEARGARPASQAELPVLERDGPHPPHSTELAGDSVRAELSSQAMERAELDGLGRGVRVEEILG